MALDSAPKLPCSGAPQAWEVGLQGAVAKYLVWFVLFFCGAVFAATQASAQSALTNKTLELVTLNSAGTSYLTYIYTSADKVFVGGDLATGLVCGVGRPLSSTHRCTKSRLADCGGWFAGFLATNNRLAEVQITCEAEVKAQSVCVDWSVRDYAEDLSGHVSDISHTGNICADIAGRSCSAAGAASMNGKRDPFAFPSCKVRDGRQF